MAKEIKTAQELDELIAQRVNKIPELVDDLHDQPNVHIVANPVYWHERDQFGANWNISGGRNIGPYTASIFAIVNELRAAYDLAEK